MLYYVFLLFGLESTMYRQYDSHSQNSVI